MAHHHEPVVDFDKKFEFDGSTRKIIIGVIIAGIILIVLGIVAAMGGGAGAAAGHGGEHHSSVLSLESIFQFTSGSHGHAAHGPVWLIRFFANLIAHSFFFTAIALLCVFFLAVKNVTNAGWYVGFMRVPEAMAHFIFIGPVFLLIGFFAAKSYLYDWSIADVVASDPLKLLPQKTWWLSTPFFVVRNILFFGIWIFFFLQLRNSSREEDRLGGFGKLQFFEKRITLSAIFIVLFALSFSAASWDWIMSLESHWFSTMFGVYCFAISWVSALSIMTLFTVFLYLKGYLQHLNISHFHDLGRHMFGFTVFWAYIWFSQFLLIWYANIPEETMYYHRRMQEYPFMFYGLIFINFIFPFLFLLRKGNLRHIPSLCFMAVIIILGHWMEIIQMVHPQPLGPNGGIGFMELGFFLLFAGLFAFVTFTMLEKAPLVPRHHPYLRESVLHET